MPDGKLADEVNLARFERLNAFSMVSFPDEPADWEWLRPTSEGVSLDSAAWRDSDKDADRAESSGSGFKASSYVPLDSWIYPVFDRLAAMGYVKTSSATVLPWTRLECARLLAEAHVNAEDTVIEDDRPESLLAALDTEFAREMNVIDGARNIGAQVESVYGRFTGISGMPLRDSFHFAQTLKDDFGRPYGQGGNGITGVSGRAEWGPFSYYLRGEYQYASAMPAYNAEAQQTIEDSDGLPFGWNLRSGTTSRMHLIEAYTALNLANWQISFGQQGLWWGPDRTTSLILSNNAEAMPMLRFARVRPAILPGILKVAGPVHFDFFFSREGGIHYVGLGETFTLYGSPSHALNPPPYMWGMTFSIKPTPNFELGFGHTTIFAGYGRPLNLRTFLHSFSISGNAQAVDPGKRTTEFNIAYHVPEFRSIVVYTEAYAYDNPVEGKFLARFAMDPGIYVPQLPGLKKVDLRMEGVYTNLPGLKDLAYFYGNAHYPQGYTNYGQILGSWVGRQGSGGQASTTYWFSGRNKATVSYRKMNADKAYLEGGNLNDISANVTWLVRPEIEFSATGMYERQIFPLLETGVKSSFTTSFGIQFFPRMRAGAN
jgi:hypothetical protein